MAGVKRKKIGLALSGGGIRGMAHVGVLRVLIDAGIPINYIAGTSIGSFVGAVYAKTQSIQALEELTLGYKKEKFITLLEPTYKGGLIKGDKVERLLKQLVGDISFSKLQIPLTIVATSLKTGKEVHYAHGSVIKAMRSSMAIPLVFAPVSFKKDLLVDGGLSNPLPTDVVKSMGADVVIAVNLDAYLGRLHTRKNMDRIRHTAQTSFDLFRYHLAQKNVPFADVVIEPHFNTETGKLWKNYFLDKKEIEFMKAGERAAKSAVPRIKKLLR